MEKMKRRKLRGTDIELSPMGLGSWAIGGPSVEVNGDYTSMGEVDEAEAIKAIHCALEGGVNFIDTANYYGAGNSEKVVGKAVKGRRESVIISTKFGNTVLDEEKRLVRGEASAPAPEKVRSDCEESLRRLGTDYIDLFFLHIWGAESEKLPPILDTLDELVAEGKIRGYGWSTDLVEPAIAFAERKNCLAMQILLNVMEDSQGTLELCEKYNLAAINRTPLGMGLLSGKYGAESRLAANDIRSLKQEWLMKYFVEGKPNAEWLERLAKVREILQSEGRSLVQGALAWIWGRSEKNVPIPGFRNVKQVEENVRAMEFGALSAAQMAEINRILER